jgi:anti-sigma B factor antagonist
MADVDDDATSARFERLGDETGESALHVAGEVDLSNAALLRQAIEEFLASAPPRLVLDVHELTFMDSSGLAVLLQAATRVEAVVVRHPRDVIRRLLETTGVTHILQMEP